MILPEIIHAIIEDLKTMPTTTAWPETAWVALREQWIKLDVRDLPFGNRCPKCHRSEPNGEGCARCDPETLGQRLTGALREVELLKETRSAMVKANFDLEQRFKTADALNTMLREQEVKLRSRILGDEGSISSIAASLEAIRHGLLDREVDEEPGGLLMGIVRALNRSRKG